MHSGGRTHRRGAHRASVPGPRSHLGPEHNAPGQRRHVGMPPYGVRRGVWWEMEPCPGGHKGRPYGVPTVWFVGRGAHTPPNRTVGTTGVAIDAALPSILS